MPGVGVLDERGDDGARVDALLRQRPAERARAAPRRRLGRDRTLVERLEEVGCVLGRLREELAFAHLRDSIGDVGRFRDVAHKVVLIPGDGTGPELTEATRRVLEATGVEFEWDVREAGADVMDKYGGNPLPPEVLDATREAGVALKGPITTPVGGGFRSVNVALRKELDMYAQVRPCKSYPGVRSRLRGRRPDHHPREHRGPLRRHRVRAGHRGRRGADPLDRVEGRQAPPPRRRHLDQADLDHGHAPHLRVRVRLCAQERPPQDHRRPQGEHHEVHRRALAARRARGRSRELRHRVRRSHRRQHVHAARPAARGVRHARAAEPLRRRALRSLRGHDRRPRPRARRRTTARTSRCSSRRTAPRRSTPGRTRSTRWRSCSRECSCSATSRSATAADRLERAIAEVIAEGKSVTYDMKPSRDDPTAVGTSQVADAIIEKLEASVPA